VQVKVYSNFMQVIRTSPPKTTPEIVPAKNVIDDDRGRGLRHIHNIGTFVIAITVGGGAL